MNQQTYLNPQGGKPSYGKSANTIAKQQQLSYYFMKAADLYDGQELFYHVNRSETMIYIRNASIMELFYNCIPERITYAKSPVAFQGPKWVQTMMEAPANNDHEWRLQHAYCVEMISHEWLKDRQNHNLLYGINQFLGSSHSIIGKVRHQPTTTWVISRPEGTESQFHFFANSGDNSQRLRNVLIQNTGGIPVIDLTCHLHISNFEYPENGCEMQEWQTLLKEKGYDLHQLNIQLPYIDIQYIRRFENLKQRVSLS